MTNWKGEDVISTQSLVDRLDELNNDLCIELPIYSEICADVCTDNLEKFIRFHNSANGDIWSLICNRFGEDDAESFIDEDMTDHTEIELICSILDKLKGYGNTKIGGIRIPCTLIKASYFPEFIIQELENTGVISGIEHLVIDKKATAEKYKIDYRSIDDIDGDEYFYRY